MALARRRRREPAAAVQAVAPAKRPRPAKAPPRAARPSALRAGASASMLRRRAARWRIEPVTPANGSDLEALFGPKGACGGCWCMFMRLPLAEFTRGKGEGNRRALRALVGQRPPGLIAYADEEPAGWIAVAPREQYARLGNSRVLAPVAGEGVWSAPCFFVKAGYRRTGLSGALLEAACEFARRNGAHSLEGYPTSNRADLQPAAFVWTGMESTFIRSGFREIARRSPTRPIMRRDFARAPKRAAPPTVTARVGTTASRRSPVNAPARPASGSPAARRSNWTRAGKPERKAVRRG